MAGSGRLLGAGGGGSGRSVASPGHAKQKDVDAATGVARCE